MALFHLHVTQVRRSAGQSVVTSAAYRAGEKLYSEYYGEVSDYTHKGGVVCTDILLPPQAPAEYKDRATLWNAVEKAERGKKAQLTSVTVSGGSFTIGGSGDSVAVGNSITTRTIQPKAGLAVGTHTGTITVTYNDSATATAMVSFTVSAKAEDTPSISINYQDETLTGFDTSASYMINGTAVTLNNGTLAATDYMGQTISIVRTARDADYTDSSAQSLQVPTRPAAPGAKITVKKTDASITITNETDFSDCEFSVDGTTWKDSKEFTGLTAGHTYPMSVRTKATGTAFASASQTVNVTTVNADGSTTVKPGESVETGTDPKTTVTNDGEKVTITTGGGTPTTVIPPTGGEVTPKGDGTVEVPDGTIVKPSNGGPDITVGPGNGGTVDGDGNVTVGGGGKVTVEDEPDDTTITLPSGGGTVKPNPDGGVDVPGGSIIQTGENGPEITVGPGNGGTIGGNGGVTVPEGGTIQIGKDPATTVTPPPSGEVKPKEDGTVEVPEGTIVKPGNSGPEVTVGPGNGGTVNGDGGVTVPGGGKVTVKGNPDATITLPSGGGTVKPNPDGTIPLPGGTVITPTGKDPITVPDGGGTYNPEDGTVAENVHTVIFDSQGGSNVGTRTATHGGTVANPGSPTRSGYVFDGWYKESACTNAWNFDTDTVTGDITLYAKWKEDVPTHTHSYPSTWSSDANHHWHECSCGEKSAIATHTPGEWIIDREATSTIVGSRHKACTVCGYITQTEGIPATGGGPGGDNSGGGGGWYNPSTTYPVTIPDMFPHGKLTVSPARAERNTTVTITVTPEDGYRLGVLNVTSGGKAIPLTDKGSGKYTFTMPAGTVKVEATFVLAETPGTPWINPFADVPEGAWYYDAVRFVSENGLMGGYGNGLFGVNDDLSRAQLAQILFNKEGRPVVNYLLQYGDVSTGTWYTEAVRWATSQGIVGGYGNGNFGPNDPITREQLAVMLWRYSGSPAATNKELHFNDADEIDGYALEALRWAVENGIINGKGGGILDPQGLVTRAQVAQMLKNFISN